MRCWILRLKGDTFQCTLLIQLIEILENYLPLFCKDTNLLLLFRKVENIL